MIVDALANRAMYDRLGADIAGALRFLQEADLAGLACGRHPIDGDRVYAVVSEYRTKPRPEGRWEAHRRYLDVHAVVGGAEGIGYAPAEVLQAIREEPERDLIWLSGDGDMVTLRPGHFLLAWPGEGHMPGLAVDEPGPVKKVVVKVLVSPGD